MSLGGQYVQNPYLRRTARRHIGQTVTLAGWVHRRRDHGGMIFIDLRDRAGLVQVVFNPQTDPDAHDLQDAALRIGRCGHAARWRRGRRALSNPNLATGEIEVVASTTSRCSTRPRRRHSMIDKDEEVDEDVAPEVPLPRPAPRRACSAT